jgi:hypothetical protein
MQRHRSLRVVSLAFAGMVLSACATTHVTTDVNAAASPSSCRSFAWLDPDVIAHRNPNAAFDNPVNDQRLRTAVAQRLEAHGVQPVVGGTAPDCLVGHAIGTRHAGTYGTNWGYGLGASWGGYPYHGYGYGYGGAGYFSGDTHDYHEGRVTIDIFRAGDRAALWHADADADVTSLRGVDAEKRINDIVAAMFAKYPAG